MRSPTAAYVRSWHASSPTGACVCMCCAVCVRGWQAVLTRAQSGHCICVELARLFPDRCVWGSVLLYGVDCSLQTQARLAQASVPAGQVSVKFRTHLMTLKHPRRSSADRPPRVLIPGAGLARLMVDVASLGFEAQGNEFSYFMLLAGSFMLNHSVCAQQWTVHPWMHSNLNHLSDEDQVCVGCVTLPVCGFLNCVCVAPPAALLQPI